MTKRVKYTAICKGWKLINLHLLCPWSTCKVWISNADVSSAVWHELYDHLNNLQIESEASLRFGPCCDGVSTVGGGVRKAGFKGGGGVRLSLSGFWEIAAWYNSGVTLKRLRRVENAVVAVEESFCVLMLSLEQCWLFLPVVFLYLIVL